MNRTKNFGLRVRGDLILLCSGKVRPEIEEKLGRIPRERDNAGHDVIGRWLDVAAVAQIVRGMLSISPRPLDRRRTEMVDGAGVALQVRQLSRTTAPAALLREALGFESLCAWIYANREGFVVDILTESCTRFAARRERLDSHQSVVDLIEIQTVAEHGRCLIHTHGMAKFACPDLECIADAIRGSDGVHVRVLAALAEAAVEHGIELVPDVTFHTADQRLYVSIASRREGEAEHYGGNDVVRIDICAVDKSPVRVPGTFQLPRAEYFYGRRP